MGGSFVTQGGSFVVLTPPSPIQHPKLDQRFFEPKIAKNHFSNLGDGGGWIYRNPPNKNDAQITTTLPNYNDTSKFGQNAR